MPWTVWTGPYCYSAATIRYRRRLTAMSSKNWNRHNHSMSSPKRRKLSGSGTTGTLEIVAEENDLAFGGDIIDMNALGSRSNLVVRLGFLDPTGANFYIGTPYGVPCGTPISAAAAPSVFHSFIGVVNGASSVFKVDGTETTGTLVAANFTKPSQGGAFGGGSLAGFTEGIGISSTIPSPSQRTVLCQIHQNHYGTTGTC